MKKVTKLVTLITTGLCALALVPAYLATVNAVQTQAESDKHAITFVADNGVTVNVPVVASAGKVVNVSVNYDADAYRVHGVLVNTNEQLAAQTSANDFYFVMPDKDVELVVVGSAITKEEDHYYAVHNVEQEKGVYLNYADPGAEAGDTVMFKVEFTTNSAYTFTGNVDVYTLDNGKEVAISQIGYLATYDVYYFTMPEAEVYIRPHLETKGYLATFSSTDNVDKVEVSSDGENWTTIKGNPYFIKAFDKVRVSVKDTLKRTCGGLTVGEETYLADSDKKVVFEMPGEDVKVTVDTEDILYTITPETDEKTSNYTYKFYRSDTSSGTYVETTAGACYNQYVRVYATLKEGVTGKKIETLQYSYDTTKSYSWTAASKSVDADGNTYFQFYLSYGQPYAIRVTSEVTAQPVTVKNTEHIKAKFVKKVDGKWVENTEGFYAGDYVYAQITAEDGYKAGSLKTSYRYSATSTYTGSTSMTTIADEANNVYRTNATITSSAYVDYAIEWEELTAKKVNFTADELVTWKFVKQDEKHDWVAVTNPQYFKGDYVYVQATFLGNADDYVWNGIKVMNGSSAITPTTQSSTDKIYSFTMPDAEVTVTASYKSASAFKGYSFVGTKFFGNNLYGTSWNKSASTSYTFTCDGSGAGQYGSNKFEILDLKDGSTKQEGIVSSVKFYGTGSTGTVYNGEYMVYGKQWVAGNYRLMSTQSYNTNDFFLSVIAQDAADTESNYSFKGYKGSNYGAAQAYRNGTYYASVFIEIGTRTIYHLSDVSFSFVTGTSVDVSDRYDVMIDGVLYGSVSGNTFTKA